MNIWYSIHNSLLLMSDNRSFPRWRRFHPSIWSRSSIDYWSRRCIGPSGRPLGHVICFPEESSNPSGWWPHGERSICAWPLVEYPQESAWKNSRSISFRFPYPWRILSQDNSITAHYDCQGKIAGHAPIFWIKYVSPNFAVKRSARRESKHQFWPSDGLSHLERQ